MRSEFMIDSLYSKYSAGLAAKKAGPKFLLSFPCNIHATWDSTFNTALSLAG